MDTLSIVFIGMIAFAETSDPDVVWSLMVDARTLEESPPACTNRANYHTNDEYLAHEAFVVVPEDATVQCTDDADLEGWEEFEPEKNCGLKRFVLDGHEIGLSATTTRTGIAMRKGRPKQDGWRPINGSEAQAFAWIAKLKTIAPTRVQVKQSCDDPNPRDGADPAKDCPIVGRMLLPSGELRTSHIAARERFDCPFNGEVRYSGYVTFDFVETGSAKSFGSSVSEEITLRVETERGTPRVLTLTRFDDANRRCFVVLPPGNERIWLLNARKGLDYYCSMEADDAPHYSLFQEFYKLSKKGHVTGVCPYPVPACKPEGSPRCPLVFMSLN